MENRPFFVSVIIPVYNGEQFIAEAIDSILAQQYDPLEIIIVDDGSTDATPDVITPYKNSVRYIRQANRGAASACNTGLTAAQGDMIGFLDADDLWTRNRLREQLPYFTQKPELDIVLGLVQIMRNSALPEDSGLSTPVESPEIAMHLGCSLFRKRVFTIVGSFDETPAVGWTYDWDWFMRARELDIEMLILPHTTMYYRRHTGNITLQVERGNRYTLEMLRKSIDRRRRLDEQGNAKSLPDLRQFLKRP
jgi:glycosyltransferase involved in cell wall biosynthesis